MEKCSVCHVNTDVGCLASGRKFVELGGTTFCFDGFTKIMRMVFREF